MHKYLTIILLVCSIASCFAENRALLIGIGAYPQNIDYYWQEINGDNDVIIAEKTLKANGFNENNITKLINSEATFQNIIKALQTLVNSAKTNDCIYIHFSGHGQKITDTNGDEKDGFDEAWISYDALQEPTDTYHGQNHLTDDILNDYLHKIRKNIGPAGKIIVVTDACFSADATRNLDEEEEVRGASSKFILPNSTHYTGKQRTQDWIALSACGENECSRQITIQNTKYGALTYALFLLKDQLKTQTALQICNTITQLFNNKDLIPLPRTQTPKLEGPEQYKQQPLL